MKNALPLLALFLVGIPSLSAEFTSETLTRGVNLYVEVDGDINTNPTIDVFGETDGLFDPANQSISETSTENGTASANIDHQSNIVFDPEALSITLSDSGAGSSAPADGRRGTLSASSELRVRFSSDVPFTFTLTSTNMTHSSGSPGNTVSVPYGVKLHSAISDTVFASFTLDSPTGTTTLTLPEGSYLLDSFSGMSFDAVFGNPPAAGGYSSDFNTSWSFTAEALPEPTVAVNGPKDFKTKRKSLKLSGTSSDASRVEVKVGKSKYSRANGVRKWSKRIRLKPRRNVVLVRSVNAHGMRSEVVRILVTRR